MIQNTNFHSHPRLGTTIAMSIVFVAAAGGCVSITAPSTMVGSPSGTAESVVPVEVSDLFAVAWLTTDVLVVQRSSFSATTSFAESRLWQLHPDGSALAEVKIDTTDSECTRLDLLGADRLPDGRLGYLRSCIRGTDSDLNALEAFDLGTGSVETLMRTERLLGRTTWAPDMQHGYTAIGGGICDGILGLSRKGIVPAPITVLAEPRPFRIDEALDSSVGQDCTQTARSVSPALSPDGKTLAFLGSPASIGQSNTARTDVPFELYLVTLESMSSSSLLNDLAHPSGPRWSPDGNWLVTAGVRSGQSGTWLVSTSDGRIVQVSAAALGSLAWALDGRHIAGLHEPDVHVFPPKVQIIIVDVTGVVGS
jgi:WD40 repeat protein